MAASRPRQLRGNAAPLDAAHSVSCQPVFRPNWHCPALLTPGAPVLGYFVTEQCWSKHIPRKIWLLMALKSGLNARIDRRLYVTSVSGEAGPVAGAPKDVSGARETAPATPGGGRLPLGT